MRTFTVPGGNPDQMRWCEDHGIDPKSVRKQVTVNDDGTMTFQRILRDERGHAYVVDDEVATEPLTVKPHRPFPGSAARCLST